MPVQWFPGHMHVTKQALLDRLPDIDVVIELLDARLPGSSASPMLAAMTQQHRKLKVLNKQDLADPQQTEAWLQWYAAQTDTAAIGLDASQSGPTARLVQACRQLAPNRKGMDRPLRILICGVPNVGKSTLLNTMVGKKAAKTGDEAGITRVEQRINLASDVYLYDTPGMLWPKIVADECGYALAASGAVGRNAYDEQEVAEALLARLQGPYGHLLTQRYRLQTGPQDCQPRALLHEIGQRRGAVMRGGEIDLQKAAEIVLRDFRSGALGRISLESPQAFEAWMAAGAAEHARLQAEREQRRAQRKGAAKSSDLHPRDPRAVPSVHKDDEDDRQD